MNHTTSLNSNVNAAVQPQVNPPEAKPHIEISSTAGKTLLVASFLLLASFAFYSNWRADHACRDLIKELEAEKDKLRTTCASWYRDWVVAKGHQQVVNMTAAQPFGETFWLNARVASLLREARPEFCKEFIFTGADFHDLTDWAFVSLRRLFHK